MSCEGHRDKYFDELEAEQQHPSLTAQRLNRLYQAGRNRPVEPGQEKLVEAKTRKLFADMQRRGIKPPTHSQSGLPKKRSQVGYAAVLDHLKKNGLFAGRGQNGQGDKGKGAQGQAAQSKGEKSAPALHFAGLDENDTREQAERFPVWKHLPRCSKCGRWMSTQNPACQNPKCGLAGMKQRRGPVKWPPEGANFKRSRVIPVTDWSEYDKLPTAEIVANLPGPGGSTVQKTVNLEYIEDGKAHFSEWTGAGGVPIKGRGFTSLSNVVAWPGDEKPPAPEETLAAAPPKPAQPEERPAWALRGRKVRRKDDPEREMYVLHANEHSMALSAEPDGSIAADAMYGLYEPVEVPAPTQSPEVDEPETLPVRAAAEDPQAILENVLASGIENAVADGAIEPDQPHTGALVLMSLLRAETKLRAAKGETEFENLLSDEWGAQALNQISPTFTAESSAHLGLLRHLRAQYAAQTEKSPLEAPGAGETILDTETGEENSTEAESGGGGHCEHCGGFLDKDGQCHNPNCPGGSEEETARPDFMLFSPEGREAQPGDPLPNGGELVERRLTQTEATKLVETIRADGQTEAVVLVDADGLFAVAKKDTSDESGAPVDQQAESAPAFDWQAAKPGDRLPDGSLLVKRRLRLKSSADAIAERFRGTVMRDGPRTWAVVTHEADEYGFMAGAGDAHDYIPEWMDIPGLHETDNDPNAIARIKLFTPDSNFTFYVTEYDGKDTCFGLVEGFDTELGYFSLSELESIHGPLGVRVERELWTAPKPIRETPEYQKKWGTDGPYPAPEEEPVPDTETGGLEAPGAAEPVESGESGGASGHCEHCGGFLDKDGQCNNPQCPGESTDDHTTRTQSPPQETPHDQVVSDAEPPRDIITDDDAWQEITQAAVDWQYLTILGGGMARKSDLDAWLMPRYNLTEAMAREVSNSVESRKDWVIGDGKVSWLDRAAGRDVPQWRDYPDLIPAEILNTWAVCDACGRWHNPEDGDDCAHCGEPYNSYDATDHPTPDSPKPVAEIKRGENTFSFYVDPDGDHKNVRIVQRTDFAGTDLEADFPAGSTLEWEVKVSADLDDPAAVNLAGRKVLEEWDDIEAPVAEIAFDPNRAALEQIVWEKLEPHGYADTDDNGVRRMSYLDPETGGTTLSPMRDVPLAVLQQSGGISPTEYAGSGGRCEHCGGFLDQEGECNNPQCPGPASDTEPADTQDTVRDQVVSDAADDAELERQMQEMLTQSGLVMDDDGRLYGDPSNPEAALEFTRELRENAAGADQQADAATDSKARRLRQNARAARRDAERIESSLARCEYCGGFLDRDGQCNNPKCPGPGTGEPALGDAVAAESGQRLTTPENMTDEQLSQNGLIFRDGELFGDPENPEAALEFVDNIRGGADYRERLADESSDIEKATEHRQRAREIREAVETIESSLARCEYCGGFLDKEGECNNPKCPGPGESTDEPADTQDTRTHSTPQGTAHDQVVSDAADETGEDAETVKPEQRVEPPAEAPTPPAYPGGTLFMRLGETEHLPPNARRVRIRRVFVQRGQRSDDPYIVDDPDERQDPFEYVALDDGDQVVGRAETAAGLRESLNVGSDPVDIGLAGDNFSDEEQQAMSAVFQRCEHCGAFADKDGNCNNPKCPGPGTGDEAPVDEARTEEEAEETKDTEDTEETDELDAEDTRLTQPRGHDYTITDTDELGRGGEKRKAQDNIAAIRLLRQLEDEDRQATPEEQAILVKYVGWGGVSSIFDWRNQYADEDGYYESGYGYNKKKEKAPLYAEWKELKELLSEDEFNSASRSTINAHYTSATVVSGVWEAIKAMGYDRPDGKILEPAAGIGHFFGMMPAEFKSASKVGVELDATTAQIAQHLYQNADIRHSGFEDTSLPDDYFDLAISNVPFGNYGVFDPAFETNDPQRKRMSKSIHNYFFAKSLDKVKPGGVVAFITSRYTMDSADPAVRKYLAEQADLVGAIRLPNTAFKENAGTEVTTDVIFLRKRFPDAPLNTGGDKEPSDTAWVNTAEVDVVDKAGEAGIVPVNQYFADHPEMMLGELSLSGSMYGGREVTLESDGRELGEALGEAIAQLPKGVLVAPQGRCEACGAFLAEGGNCNNPNCSTTRSIGGSTLRPAEAKRVLADPGLSDGRYVIRDGEVYRVEDSALVPHEKSGQLTKSGAEAMEIRRIRGMLPVHEAARAALRLNVEEASTEELAQAQAKLNQAYDEFVAEFGPLNARANQRALEGDSSLPFLMALENKYDKETNSAEKGAIFEQRVIAIQKTVESADSAQDALRVTLNEYGLVNWSRMTALTGKSPAELQKELLADGVIFQAPDGQWVAAEAYLSGNVREKLRQAEAAAALDPAFRRNVEALQEAVPVDLEPEEIKAALGSPWIPPEDISAFASHLFGGADFEVSFIAATAEWKVKAKKTRGWGREVFDRDSAENMQVWGTAYMNGDARTLLEKALNGVAAQITVKGEDGKRHPDEERTIEARERQDKIKAEFEKWIFASDQERTDRLAAKYNELYNSEVPRQFDGAHVTLPGMAANMPELRAHQKNAVWRISQGENVLLAHVVGAGKTFAMIGGSMELRRMGLRKKPMHVIPNHMLEQYTADIYRMYPAANVLAIPSKALSPQKRAETMSRIATGDWDAVVVTHSALSKLPVSHEMESKFHREEIADLREALELSRMDDDSKLTVKKLEKKLASEEAKLKATMAKIRARQDDDGTITFDELGVDQLIVDEADMFKNLQFTTRRTNLPGVGGTGSDRAKSLYVKIRTMKEIYGDDQSVVFATGTPIANSISEMYTMQRFLDHDNLKEKGLAHFDSWASQFGDTVTSIEMKPSGGGYQTKTRFAQYNNVPELKRMFMRFADIQVDPEALNLPRPKLAEDEEGVRRQRGVAVPASEELSDYIAHLVERAENLDPRDRVTDNMLKITSEGRMAALDMRLVDPDAEDNPHSKLNKAVENVFGIYQRTTGVKVSANDDEHNMAQMIFCDLGTPAAAKKGKFSVYHDIQRKLVARGVKPDEIAFMQDYKSDEKKADLFQRVNEGKVRVLIGSTQTMGAGTNAQKRLAALHHLDAPWRPRDVEQREGRILRPGNLNDEVEVHRYLTEESFDVYNWQLLERKQRFIAQVMNNDLTERSAEDVDQEALTYAEMKALATGNPAVIEKVAVDAELRKLSALEASSRQRSFKLRQKAEKLPKEIAETRTAIERTRGSLAAIEQAEQRRAGREAQAKAEVAQARTWARQAKAAAKESGTPAAKEQAETASRAAKSKAERFQAEKGFEITVRGRSWDTRQRGGNSLASLESEIIRAPQPGQTDEVGEFMGFPLLVKHPNVPGGSAKFYLKLTDDEAQLIPSNKDSGRTFDPTGNANNITRIRRALKTPARRLEQSEQKAAGLQKELESVQASGGAFEHQERFDFLKKREQELDAVMAALQEK